MTGNDRAPLPERARALLVDLSLTALALTVDVGMNTGEAKHWRTGGPLPFGVLLAVTSIVSSALLFRRRRPAAVLGVQVGYALLILALAPSVDLIAGLLVALYALAGRREPSRSVPGMLAVEAVAGAQLLSTPDQESWDGAWLVALLSGVIVLAVWAAGHRSWAAQNRLTTMQADQRAARAEALREERLRIARELHDIVAGSVSVMILQAAGAQAALRQDLRRAEVALGVIQDTGTQAMAELRRLLGLLRTAGEVAGDAALLPTMDGIAELLETMRGVGLTIAFRVSGTPAPIDPSVSLACYRVVQESLTNTVKHAGPGATADVHLAWNTDNLVLRVADRGGDTPGDAGLSTGHGLLGLRERVGALGGIFTSGPGPDGFVVRAELPIGNDAPRLATRSAAAPARPA